ncbi:carboxymuconolactone decarboxylase family protein [Nocardia yunnanensis]|uniref:Carboxymuconolactone decarboxylase family protein n=1 Tax=Nocardia yunnanensis TaxID=2382165 RepID=A0A386ZET8_9NOCA|nr:carboxymuconolactone decarboxylase family protein [Nocardia yunnanensis]AYF76392.1 carboxymuconolactone decarboxylase family protein [Nocardia yunnanensis]
MRTINRIVNYLRVFGRARRHRTDLAGWLVRRPLLLLGTGIYESMLMFSNRVDPHLKELAELKTAALVNCEFCLDIGSALAHYGGLTEAQVTELSKYRDSAAYNELEKLVLAYAEAMTVTPTDLDLEELRAQLSKHLSRAQLAELAAAIAWENQRSRLNQGLGVRATGMADGMACALPEPRRAAE